MVVNNRSGCSDDVSLVLMVFKAAFISQLHIIIQFTASNNIVIWAATITTKEVQSSIKSFTA